MKKQLITSFSIALVALLFLITSVFYQSAGCDPITAYCLKITDLLILFLIFFVLLMILSSRKSSLVRIIDCATIKKK